MTAVLSDTSGQNVTTPDAPLFPARGLSPTRRMIRRFRRNRLAVISLGILFFIALAAILADWVALQSPYSVDLMNLRKPPSPTHWLGTDPSGRDVFARVVHGARVSLAVGILSVLLYVAIGTFLGLLSGFYGGWIVSSQ